MKKRLPVCRAALWLALCVAAVAGASPAPQQTAAGVALGRLVEGYWQAHLRLRPLHATLLADHRYDADLPNSIGSAHLAREYALEKRALAALGGVNVAALSARDRLTYDAFRWDRQMEIEGFRYPAELLPLSSAGGMPGLMAQFGSGAGAQPFASVRDYNNWLRRLDGYVIWLDQVITNLRRGLSRGYVLPRTVVERMLPPIHAVTAVPVAQSLFMRPVDSFPAAVPPAEQVRLRAAYRAAVIERVNPAYRRLYQFLREEYLPRARASIAWSDLPQGRAWYAYKVRRSTTTALTPEQIHRLGLDEVRRLGAEVDRLGAELGLRGERRAFGEAMRADPHAYYDNEDEFVAGYEAVKSRVRARLGELIELPTADFEIHALDSARSAGASPLSFRPASPDGARVAILYVNTAELKVRPKYEIDAFYLREVEPGKLLQVSVQRQAGDLPSFRRYGGYFAYSEGWGAYAQSLGRELGVYVAGESALSATSAELLRAARMVVDTGVHAQGWTRQQALDYLQANCVLAPGEAATELDRVIANPAQSLAYAVGALDLRELRSKASRALGARFDVKAFHRELLIQGPLPLEVLEADVARWLAERGAAP